MGAARVLAEHHDALNRLLAAYPSVSNQSTAFSLGKISSSISSDDGARSDGQCALGYTIESLRDTHRSIMKYLYIDESGDHDLVRISKDYPVFVLAGILVDKAYHDSIITPELNQFKAKYLTPPLPPSMHLYEARHGIGDYEFLRDHQIRRQFWGELAALMNRWDYEVIACVIDKPNHVAKHGQHAWDPYLMSLEILIQRFVFDLNDKHETGIIVAEARRPKLDQDLRNSFQQLQNDNGFFSYVPGVEIQNAIDALYLETKQAGIAGLQMADFIAWPIGRHHLGKSDGHGWRVAERKFRRNPEDGDYDGYGLVVLP